MDPDKTLSVTIKVTRRKPPVATEDTVQEKKQPYLTIRLFSEWVQCSCSSPAVGSDGLPWCPFNDELEVATYKANVTPDVSNETALHLFNNKPGIYATFIADSGPIGFTYVDCSSFVLEGGVLTSRNCKVLDFDVSMSASLVTPLLSRTDALKLEPVTIEFKR
jgi:hypothetical protein